MIGYLADANRFRTITTGICLIAAPLALLAGAIIHPGLRIGERAQLVLIAHHPGAWYANHILGFIAMILLIPATLGLVHILREREPVLGHLGGSLTLLGLMAFEGVVVVYGFVAWQMVHGGNLTEMTNLFHRLKHTAGVAIPLGVMSGALVPGMGLLAIGLVRSRAVQIWAGPVAALGTFLFLLGGLTAHMAILIAGNVLMLIGLATIGLHVLRAPGEGLRGSRDGSSSLPARHVARHGSPLDEPLPEA